MQCSWIAGFLLLPLNPCSCADNRGKSAIARPEGPAAHVERIPEPSSPSTVHTTRRPSAKIGEAAPEFSLPDIDGRTYRLRDYAGKIVVLEWFNPECVEIRGHHISGGFTALANDWIEDEGVVWLAINSAGPGMQGHGLDATEIGARMMGIDFPVLLDESGTVGRAYGASNTPHMFIIDRHGTLVYMGAIDSFDSNALSRAPQQTVNYVSQALGQIVRGEAVVPSQTRPYGCPVRYGPLKQN